MLHTPLLHYTHADTQRSHTTNTSPLYHTLYQYEEYEVHEVHVPTRLYCALWSWDVQYRLLVVSLLSFLAFLSFLSFISVPVPPRV